MITLSMLDTIALGADIPMSRLARTVHAATALLPTPRMPELLSILLAGTIASGRPLQQNVGTI